MRAMAPIFVAFLLALSVSGCDKCGDWAWERGAAKTCHDESQLK
jgi:hypothetical protein